MAFSKIQARLDKVVTFIIGSPFKPALNRHEFIRASLFLFLLRCPIMLVLGLIALELLPSLKGNGLGQIYAFFVLLPVASIFYAQYFFVFYRRLKGIGFKFPGILTWSFVVIAFFLLLTLPESYFTEDSSIFLDVLDVACHLVPYLLLLPWKDKQKPAG